MIFRHLAKFTTVLSKAVRVRVKSSVTEITVRRCHSVFGVTELWKPETPDNVSVLPITRENHEVALEAIKNYYLQEHVLVRARNIHVSEDRALDEYLTTLLKQGNSILAKDENYLIGICVSFASSVSDLKNLRNYASYRQDPNIKDFLNFTAKLQETPNLWDLFNVDKVFEIKIVGVAPSYRRRGVAVMMVERAMELARNQGYSVVRMDCINPHDYKIAERCMLQCLAKYPLHKVRGENVPFIDSNSEYNRHVRVYVNVQNQCDSDRSLVRRKRAAVEALLCDM